MFLGAIRRKKKPEKICLFLNIYLILPPFFGHSYYNEFMAIGQTMGQKRVLVEFDNSKNCYVNAYLLKKQGLSCQLIGYDFEDHYKKILGMDHFSLKEEITEAARLLEMPYAVVDISLEIKEFFIDPLIASLIKVEHLDLQGLFHQVIYRRIESYLEAERFDYLAISLRAKIRANQNTQSVDILSYDEIQLDQSHVLGKVSADLLKKMINPIGDLREKEIEKLYELLNLSIKSSEDRINLSYQKLFENFRFTNFLIDFIHKTFIKGCTIVDFQTKHTIADSSQHCFIYLGQKNLKSFLKNDQIDNDKMILRFDPKNKKFFCDYAAHYVYSDILVSNFNKIASIDEFQNIPILCKTENSEWLEGKLIFKNNQTVHVELKALADSLIYMGESLAIYVKKTDKLRLIGAGNISRVGKIYRQIFIDAPFDQTLIQGLENNHEQNTDYTISF